MTLKTARDHFESAQRAANTEGNTALELMAAGMAELAKSLASETRALKDAIETVESKVRSLR